MVHQNDAPGLKAQKTYNILECCSKIKDKKDLQHTIAPWLKAQETYNMLKCCSMINRPKDLQHIRILLQD